MKNRFSKLVTGMLVLMVSFIQIAATTAAGAASWWYVYQPKTPKSLQK